MVAVIDVSQWQSQIDWPSVKASGIQLAIMKATEGVGFEDPRFAQNWAGAAAAGLRRGAYHFARPDAGNDPVAEARYFLSVVQPQPDDLLALDYEVPDGAAWCLAWLRYVQSQAGRIPVFYSNYSGCARVASDAAMGQFPLWLAWPGDGIHTPAAPAPWQTIELWQYAVGTVPGIIGNVDEDVNLGLFGPGGGSATPSTAVRRRPVSVSSENSINLFGRSTDNSLSHQRFDAATMTWSDWEGLGGILTTEDIEVVQRGESIDVFVIGTGGGVYQISSNDDGRSWGSWINRGHSLAAAQVAAVASFPAPPATVDLSAVLQAEASTLAAVKAIPIADQSQVLAAIADLKAHPSFDPNDAATLAIVSRLESALKGA